VIQPAPHEFSSAIARARACEALARGAACQVDFSDHFDFFRHACEPVEALRQRWGVPPLAA
jgi:hypothetical protein